MSHITRATLVAFIVLMTVASFLVQSASAQGQGTSLCGGPDCEIVTKSLTEAMVIAETLVIQLALSSTRAFTTAYRGCAVLMVHAGQMPDADVCLTDLKQSSCMVPPEHHSCRVQRSIVQKARSASEAHQREYITLPAQPYRTKQL